MISLERIFEQSKETYYETLENSAQGWDYDDENDCNGPVDHVRWKKSTRYGNSHKSGMAYLLYRLSPERPESKAKMQLHLKNVDAAYMDMPDGHACPMMGLVWGWRSR